MIEIEDIFTAYKHSIQPVKLTFEDELSLSRRIIDENDSEALKILVEANLPLVISIAINYANYYSLLDLIQAGNLGLIRAAKRYDYRRNLRFSTCAYPWIKQAMIQAIRQEARAIRLPDDVHDKRKYFLRTIEEYSQKRQVDFDSVDREEILTKLFTASEAERLRHSEHFFVSTDDVDLPFDDDGVQTAFVSELRAALEAEVDALLSDDREKFIVRNYLSPNPMMSTEVAKQLCISPMRVKQMQNNAFKRLQKSEHLRQYLEYLSE